MGEHTTFDTPWIVYKMVMRLVLSLTKVVSVSEAYYRSMQSPVAAKDLDSDTANNLQLFRPSWPYWASVKAASRIWKIWDNQHSLADSKTEDFWTENSVVFQTAMMQTSRLM